MAVTPAPIPSVLDAPKFHPGRYWFARITSVLVVALAMAAFHNFVSPQLGIYDVRLIVLAFLFGTLAVSLNLINGITGQFSIGHAAFYLIGAITSGKLTVVYWKSGAVDMSQPLWLFLMMLAGGIAAAIAGLIVGLPSLRLRGDYLAVATLGFGEIVNVIQRNQDGGKQSILGLDLGGSYGLQGVPKLTEIWYVLILFVITVAVTRNLIRSAHGLSFLAVREDELAADATGVNTTRVKVTAFVLGAAIAGMAGVLYAHYNGSVPPDDFKMDTSFILVAMVVIGGTGSITGAAAAGITLKLLEEGLRKVPAIPAIDLFALLGLAIAVFAGYRALAKRGKLGLDGAMRPFWVSLGVLLCLLVPFVAFKTYGSELSWVLKSAAWLFMALLLVGILATPVRAAYLARFGLFGFCAALVFLAKPLVAVPLSAVGPIVDLVGKTTYKAADLRWAIFSLALIFVMILRPQGIMGHHELSGALVKQFILQIARAPWLLVTQAPARFRRRKEGGA